MSKTNDQLAQLAAERLASEKQLRGTEAFAAKVIADTYAQAVQGWIPCSERLPEVDEPVWAWDGNQMHILVVAVMSDGMEDLAVWCNTYYRVSYVGGKFVADDAHYDDDYEPLYWKPFMPQPPEATT